MLPALAVDSQGNVYLAYGQVASDQTTGDLYLVRRDQGSDWSTVSPELVNEAGDFSKNYDPPVLALDSQDNLFVGWGCFMLKQRSASTASWQLIDNFAAFGTGDNWNLVVRDDRPHWICGGTDIQDTGWHPLWSNGSQIVEGVGHSESPSIAVEPDGTLLAAWEGDRNDRERLYRARHNPAGTVTKRYYAGEQQLALRVNDELYYVLPDPTGSSFRLTYANGITAGHIIYEPFGDVLTNTISSVLSPTLAGQNAVVDPSVGLVHLGGGRWYDPALGRPLQPNPMGGPPAVPQALNRYAATPVRQPGEAAGVSVTTFQPNLIFTASRDTILQTAMGYAAEKAVKATGWGSLTIITSKSTWYRTVGKASLGLRQLFRRSVAQPQFGKTFRAYTTLGQVRALGKGQYLTEMGQVIDTSRLPASARVRFSPRFGNLLGGGAAFGISAIFQGIEDYIFEPNLTFEQRTGRVIISGLGGTSIWIIGGIATEIAAGAGAGSWAGPIGIGVGAVVTFVWIVWMQPAFFEETGLEAERNLTPLQN